MSAGVWLKKNNIDLRKCSGVVKDDIGNMAIERNEGGWVFYSGHRASEIPKRYWKK